MPYQPKNLLPIFKRIRGYGCTSNRRLNATGIVTYSAAESLVEGRNVPAAHGANRRELRTMGIRLTKF